MTPFIRAILVSILLVAVSGINLADANSSGKTGSTTSGCGCHTTDAMIVPTMNGLPSSYSPGTTYSLTWTGSGMSSSGQGGFNLDSSSGSWTNLGTRVKAASGELTHSNDGQRSWTADWTAPAVGTGDVVFDLAVLYANGNSMNSNDNWGTASWTVPEGAAPPTNTPPVASNVMITPNGNVEVDQSLTLSYTYSDDDGDLEGTTQVRWFVNGILRSSFNDASTIPSSSTSVGEEWTVKVTPHDGTEFGATVDGLDSADIIDIDSDGDGTLDGDDAFPDDPNEDTDSDSDGVGDNADAFPSDPNETMDSDMDGVGDNADAFPDDPAETMDSDGDGVGDNEDVFDSDPTETKDSDGDGVGDNADAFPNDANESMDSDMDGVGDNADVFPNDASETIDSDMDGVGDNSDAFPNDANETLDSDMDGVGDNADALPNDANETMDSDMDGVGDNADAFPNDSTETMDSDGDGVGDNEDVFDSDPTETKDSDGDMVGDNSDEFPNDSNESKDSDDDGVGDNADAFPNDPDETKDSDGDGVGDNEQLAAEKAAAETDDDDDNSSMIIIVSIILLVVVGIAVFMIRQKEGDTIVESPKNFDQQLMPGQFKPFQPTHTEAQVTIPQNDLTQSYNEPITIAEPAVVQQWTDENGNTWRSMDNGTTLWWNGTDWQQA